MKMRMPPGVTLVHVDRVAYRAGDNQEFDALDHHVATLKMLSGFEVVTQAAAPSKEIAQ